MPARGHWSGRGGRRSSSNPAILRWETTATTFPIRMESQDVDQLQGVGLADVGQIFGAGSPNPNLSIAINRHPGKHTLLVSGFELLGGAAERKDKLAIDQFEGPQLGWISPGGAALRLDTSRDHAACSRRPSKLSHGESDNGIVFFVRNPAPGDTFEHHPHQLLTLPRKSRLHAHLHATGEGQRPRGGTSL